MICSYGRNFSLWLRSNFLFLSLGKGNGSPPPLCKYRLYWAIKANFFVNLFLKTQIEITFFNNERIGRIKFAWLVLYQILQIIFLKFSKKILFWRVFDPLKYEKKNLIFQELRGVDSKLKKINLKLANPSKLLL